MMKIGPVPWPRPAAEVDPAHLPGLKAEVERRMAEAPRAFSVAVDDHTYRGLRRLGIANALADQESRLLDLYKVKVTIDGPAPTDVAAVADRLRTMITGSGPAPEVLVVGTKWNRAERRRDAAQARYRRTS